MKTQRTNRGAITRFGHTCLPVLLVLLSLVSAGVAANKSKHGPKAAPDIDNFPVNPDGTVDVIVQFKPDAFENDKNFHPNDKLYSGPHGDRKKQTVVAAHAHFKQDHRAKYERDLHATFKREFGAVHGASVRIPVPALDRLLQDDHVLYVSPDRRNKSMWDDAAAPINAPVARQNYGVDGSGIGIAVIDSGVYLHDDLQTADMTASRVVYSESFVPNDPTTNDAYGHGTHVAGIAAGNGHDSALGYAEQYVGIAPNANIINLRVLDANGGGGDSSVIAAINRAIQLKDQYNIRVINLSLGRPVYESYTVDPLCQAVEQAWQAGIVVVVAAGNLGRDNSFGEKGYGTIQAPGNDPNVITVGAMNPVNTWTRTDDVIDTFSSKGPSLVDHIAKPDIVAPGNKITSLESPGSTIATSLPAGLLLTPAAMCGAATSDPTVCGVSAAGQYMELSGTSMATPVVAGAAALMIQANSSATPDSIKALMMKNAWKGYPQTPMTTYDLAGNAYTTQPDLFTYGAGYLDIQATLADNTVVSGGATSPAVVYDSTTGATTLVNTPSVVYGPSVWSSSSTVLANSVVWGQAALDGSSMLFAESVVWGQLDDSACSVVWGESVVWGQLDDDNSQF